MISRREFLVTSGVAVVGRRSPRRRTRVALVGIAARKSVKSGSPVMIAELTTLEPR